MMKRRRTDGGRFGQHAFFGDNLAPESGSDSGVFTFTAHGQCGPGN